MILCSFSLSSRSFGCFLCVCFWGGCSDKMCFALIKLSWLTGFKKKSYFHVVLFFFSFLSCDPHPLFFSSSFFSLPYVFNLCLSAYQCLSVLTFFLFSPPRKSNGRASFLSYDPPPPPLENKTNKNLSLSFCL